MFTYCPIKLLAKSLDKENKITMIPGGINVEVQCDKEKCGFWAVGRKMCGIAATGSLFTDPYLVPRKDTDEV